MLAYERNQREAALADAKQVEKTLQIPAKVVRETYYPAAKPITPPSNLLPRHQTNYPATKPTTPPPSCPKNQ